MFMRFVASSSLIGLAIVTLAGPALGQVDGSGTAGRLAKFSDPDTVANSALREDASGNVAVGVNTHPAVRFLVGGILAATNNHASLGSLIANQNGAGPIAEFRSAGTIRSVFRSDGSLGVGTAVPADQLHMLSAAPNRLLVESTAALTFAGVRCKAPGFEWFEGGCNACGIPGAHWELYDNLGGDPTVAMVVMQDSGNIGLVFPGGAVPQHPIHVGNGAHLTAGGVWTDASSRELKENIRDLDAAEALSAVERLRPSLYNYRNDQSEQHVGFIAEDVPDLVATKDRKGMSPMDVAAVLTKVVQSQQDQLESQRAEIEALKKAISDLRAERR
jgi:hypothetical protein